MLFWYLCESVLQIRSAPLGHMRQENGKYYLDMPWWADFLSFDLSVDKYIAVYRELFQEIKMTILGKQNVDTPVLMNGIVSC